MARDHLFRAAAPMSLHGGRCRRQRATAIRDRTSVSGQARRDRYPVQPGPDHRAAARCGCWQICAAIICVVRRRGGESPPAARTPLPRRPRHKIRVARRDAIPHPAMHRHGIRPNRPCRRRAMVAQAAKLAGKRSANRPYVLIMFLLQASQCFYGKPRSDTRFSAVQTRNET